MSATAPQKLSAQLTMLGDTFNRAHLEGDVVPAIVRQLIAEDWHTFKPVLHGMIEHSKFDSQEKTSLIKSKQTTFRVVRECWSAIVLMVPRDDAHLPTAHGADISWGHTFVVKFYGWLRGVSELCNNSCFNPSSPATISRTNEISEEVRKGLGSSPGSLLGGRVRREVEQILKACEGDEAARLAWHQLAALDLLAVDVTVLKEKYGTRRSKFRFLGGPPASLEQLVKRDAAVFVTDEPYNLEKFLEKTDTASRGRSQSSLSSSVFAVEARSGRTTTSVLTRAF